MHDTLKTNCEEKTQEKKDNNKKNGVNGIRTHIHKNRWLLVYIYSKKRAFYILRYRVTRELHVKIVVNYQAKDENKNC